MVKIRENAYTEESPFIVNIHCGGDTARSPYAWHCIYAYPAEYEWLFMAGNALPNPLDLALCYPACHTYAALPCLVRDCCPSCSGQFPYLYSGPKIPRFNIYRGENHEYTPPCIVWDWLRDDPPPGFEWWHW